MPSPRVPETHIVDVQQAVDTLDYEEMIALSGMYDRWIFTERNITAEDRTRLVQLSADYERIAQYVGPGWNAGDPGPEMGPVQFAARVEKRDQERRRALEVHDQI